MRMMRIEKTEKEGVVEEIVRKRNEDRKRMRERTSLEEEQIFVQIRCRG